MTRALLLCLLLAACSTFPKVDAAFDSNAKMPSLLPSADLPAVAKNPTTDPLAARMAALRARAAALRSQ